MQAVPIELLQAAEDWEREAQSQRRMSPTNPVADTLAYCAADLRERAKQADAARRTCATAEYARTHGVAPATVRKWCARGELPGATRTVGGDWCIPFTATRHVPSRQRAARG